MATERGYKEKAPTRNLISARVCWLPGRTGKNIYHFKGASADREIIGPASLFLNLTFSRISKGCYGATP
jgi:hypothetical protein